MKRKIEKLQQKSDYQLQKGMHKINDIINRQQNRIAQLLEKYDVQYKNPIDIQAAKYKNHYKTVELIEDDKIKNKNFNNNMYANQNTNNITINTSTHQRVKVSNNFDKNITHKIINKSAQNHYNYNNRQPINQIQLDNNTINSIIKLPNIKSKNKNSKSNNNRRSNNNYQPRVLPNQYHTQLKGQLRRIYGKNHSINYISQRQYSQPSRLSIKKNLSRKKSHSRFLKKSQRGSKQFTDASLNSNNNRKSQNNKDQSDLSQNLLLNKDNKKLQQQPLSSDDDQAIVNQIMPLSSYKKQFIEKMGKQCLQGLNFLYFSRNQSMKDWSQGMLSLFQRHDKQIVALRKNAKYLQKMDKQYFSIGILQN